MDEANGWEQIRLALPTTARQVVRARYASMALTTLVAAVAGFATGRIAEELSRVTTSAAVPHGGIEAVQAAFASGLGVLAYLALLMPLIFRMGMRRARPFFMLPFLAMLFLNVSGVRDAVVSVVSLLKDLVSSLGPAPLLAAAAVGTAALYVLSMLVAERLYASREL